MELLAKEFDAGEAVRTAYKTGDLRDLRRKVGARRLRAMQIFFDAWAKRFSPADLSWARGLEFDIARELFIQPGVDKENKEPWTKEQIRRIDDYVWTLRDVLSGTITPQSQIPPAPVLGGVPESTAAARMAAQQPVRAVLSKTQLLKARFALVLSQLLSEFHLMVSGESPWKAAEEPRYLALTMSPLWAFVSIYCIPGMFL